MRTVQDGSKMIYLQIIQCENCSRWYVYHIIEDGSMGHIATRAMLATYSLLFTQYQSNELNLIYLQIIQYENCSGWQ